jgi:hypothetical protein
MKTVRRVTVSTPGGKEALRLAGVEGREVAHMAFADIEEGSAPWLAFTALCSDFSSTARYVFSERERAEADWCFVKGGKHAGYAIDGFWEVCFDYANQCRTCGLGARQVMPLRLAKVPKLSHGILLELVNLWGPLLTTPSSFSEFFLKHNVTTMSVHDEKGNPIEGLVQLVAPPFDPGHIEHRTERCSTCGHDKYWTQIGGFFPRLERYPGGTCGTSIRPFGGGAGLSVWYPTFVGGALKAELIARKVKCDLWPVAD